MTARVLIDIHVIEHSLTHQPSLFVDRADELLIAEKKVRQAQAKGPIEDPIINFWGIKGIGKTWILRHLHHLYSYRADAATAPLALRTFTLLYTFADDAANSSLEEVTSTLAQEVLAQLGPILQAKDRAQLSQAKDTRSVEGLVKTLQALSRRMVPLILLDNTEKVPPADWEHLERSLIEPLVSGGRALIVVAGRRQVPRWRRFEVRRRFMEPEKSRVHPFDKQAVIRQIEQRKYQIPVDLLFPYTAGSPHLVDAVAQHIITWTQNAQGVTLDQQWFDQHQNDLLKILHASETQLLANVSETLLPILDAVSTLRFYRLEALRAMLTIRGMVTDEPDGYYLNILRDLDQQTEVVWWDRERRAYVTSQVIRQLVNRRQLLENRETYVTRHRQALAMYWDWVRDYPEASEDFIVEIWFHLACLYLADRSVDKLRSEAKTALHFAHSNLNSDRFMILPEQLRGDREFRDLVPAELYDELTDELGQLLSDKSYW